MERSGRLSQRIVLACIRKDLLGLRSERMREGQSRYFKEQVRFIGCSVPQCVKVAREWHKRLKADGWAYGDVLSLSEELLKKQTFEEGVVALELTSLRKKEFRISDIDTFERWLRKYVNNWAHTDSIAPHIVGELLEKYPILSSKVFKWTKSDNRWVRRAAAVAYVTHGRNGRFHPQIFKTAGALLADEDEMVQKGVGWVLKEASKADEGAVVKYLMKNRHRTSRLVLRYATEKVSEKNRKAVLELGKR